MGIYWDWDVCVLVNDELFSVLNRRKKLFGSKQRDNSDQNSAVTKLGSYF